MSSDSEPDNDSIPEVTTVGKGAKRNTESLFMGDDEAVDGSSSNGVKRVKLSDSSSPPEPSVNSLTTNGEVPAYDAFAREGRPQLAIYHPSFPKAEEMVTKTCDGFISEYNKVKEDGYNNPEMEKIVTKTFLAWRYPPNRYPSVHPVGFLGPAGVGKSSGINCYVSQQAAAVENDSGSRGTNVVHEYSAARTEQVEVFCVIVRYLGRMQIEKLIQKHYRHIMGYKTLTRESSGEHDEDELKDMKQKHDTGVDFFLTLLRDREEFEDVDETSEYFDDRRSDDEDDVVSDLKGYVDELLDSEGIRDNEYSRSHTAESESELNDIFQAVSGVPGSTGIAKRKPSLWPLILKVEVHQDKDILNAGVVLADLPGVTDTNQTVIQNTKNYIKGAGTILVFATPSRIEKNPDLEANLTECVKRRKMHSTYLIVTNIDNKSTFKATEKANLLPEDKEELQAAEEYVHQLKHESVKIAQAKETTNDLEVFRKHDDRLRKLENMEKAASMKVKQVSIEIRNRHIQRVLKGKFRDLTGDKKAPDLKIFFTSNAEYQKHLAGYDVKDPPILDIKATGIPAVRCMLYEVPARGKITTLSRIVTSRLPNIFNGIIGCLTKSRLERKKDVEKLIIKVLEEDTKVVQLAMNELQAQFNEHIQQTFKANEPKWKKVGEAKVTEWSEFKSVTFAAFCRRVGDWRPSKEHRESLNWNKEIQSIFAGKVNAAFNSLEEDLDQIESDTMTNISNLYQKLQDELEACEAFQGADEKPFFTYFHGIKEKVSSDVSNHFEEFKAEVGSIRNATTMDGGDSYATMSMQDTYLECLKVASTSYAPPLTYVNRKGKLRKKSTVHAARVELIRKRLTGDGDVKSVFAAVSGLATRSFTQVLEQWAKKWYAKVGGGSTAVIGDFNARFNEPDAVKSEEDQELVELLKKAAVNALGKIEGETMELVEQCVEYEKSAR